MEDVTDASDVVLTPPTHTHSSRSRYIVLSDQCLYEHVKGDLAIRTPCDTEQQVEETDFCLTTFHCPLNDGAGSAPPAAV